MPTLLPILILILDIAYYHTRTRHVLRQQYEYNNTSTCHYFIYFSAQLTIQYVEIRYCCIITIERFIVQQPNKKVRDTYLPAASVFLLTKATRIRTTAAAAMATDIVIILLVDFLFFRHFSQYRSDSESQNDPREPLGCCPEYFGAEAVDGLATNGSGMTTTCSNVQTFTRVHTFTPPVIVKLESVISYFLISEDRR